MTNSGRKSPLISALLGLALLLPVSAAVAGGPVGDHVNHLKENLDTYSREVSWIIEKIDDMVKVYEKQGAKAANTGQVVDHWEAVDFHSAIETN
ncbi:MAG: hypothetical protein R3208_14670 [Ketobacteraceae bacterium]|nr:hypothetical protein [Ketobacteraceae bacterium]